MAEDTPPPPLVGLPGAQLGEVRIDAVGGDRINYNDPAAWLEFIKGQLWRAEEQRDIRHKEQLDRMERLEDALKLHEIAEEHRRSADDKTRQERQEALDKELAALRAEQARTRRWVVGLAIALLIAALVVVALVVDRYALATAARILIGAGLALAVGRR